MKIPRARWSARAVLLVMAERRITQNELSRKMWEFKIPAIIWQAEMTDLQITVAHDGRLRLPPKVAVIPPPQRFKSSDGKLFGATKHV